MLFPTFSFFLFFAVVFLLYWYVCKRPMLRKLLLLVASYVFYASWDVRFCLLLFTVTIINYLFALILSREKEYNVRVVVISIITFLNVLYLFCFKYFYDMMSFAAYIFPSMLDANVILPKIASSLFLPIGISYYTFKCMSYTFDVYRCKMRIEKKHLIDTLLYVSFFPQLSSGPIVTAAYFFADLPNAISRDQISSAPIEADRAMLLIVSGLFKKLILSSFLTILVCDKVFAMPSAFNTVELIMALLSYTFVIYADFSGYSDLSIAIALLLGFQTPKNFDRPYMSSSVSKFWRRWHISFSSWLREYVYFPSGGSRHSLFRTSLSIILTMTIAGLWHGLTLPFLFWGLLQGVLLTIEKIVSDKIKIKKAAFIDGNMEHKKKNAVLFAIVTMVKVMLVFLFTNISWLIFRSESLLEVWEYVHSLSNVDLPFSITSPIVIILLIWAFVMQMPPRKMREAFLGAYSYIPLPIKTAIFTVAIIIVHLFSTSGVPPFLYFAF